MNKRRIITCQLERAQAVADLPPVWSAFPWLLRRRSNARATEPPPRVLHVLPMSPSLELFCPDPLKLSPIRSLEAVVQPVSR